MSHLPRVLVPTSVLPVALGGGEAVLARHLETYDRVLVIAADRDQCPLPAICIRRPKPWWAAHGRLGQRLVRAASLVGIDFELNVREALRAAKNFEPDIVLTVAHGSMMFVAEKIATRLRLPLAALFHDWWPDFQPARYRRAAERRFRSFHRRTDVALCVSEEMKRQLGDRPADVVLPPLPPQLASMVAPPLAGRPLELHYHGNLSGAYRLPIVELVRAAQHDKRFKITLAGPLGPGAETEPQPFDRTVYRGFLSMSALNELRHQSDALLVVASFYEGDRRRMETNFPSKIPEYCQLDRPIFVWGPETSSAVRWSRSTGAAVAVCDPSPTELLTRIATTMTNEDEVRGLIDCARRQAATCFSPQNIRLRFDQELLRLRKNKTTRAAVMTSPDFDRAGADKP